MEKEFESTKVDIFPMQNEGSKRTNRESQIDKQLQRVILFKDEIFKSMNKIKDKYHKITKFQINIRKLTSRILIDTQNLETVNKELEQKILSLHEKIIQNKETKINSLKKKVEAKEKVITQYKKKEEKYLLGEEKITCLEHTAKLNIKYKEEIGVKEEKLKTISALLWKLMERECQPFAAARANNEVSPNIMGTEIDSESSEKQKNSINSQELLNQELRPSPIEGKGNYSTKSESLLSTTRNEEEFYEYLFGTEMTETEKQTLLSEFKIPMHNLEEKSNTQNIYNQEGLQPQRIVSHNPQLSDTSLSLYNENKKLRFELSFLYKQIGVMEEKLGRMEEEHNQDIGRHLEEAERVHGGLSAEYEVATQTIGQLVSQVHDLNHRNSMLMKDKNRIMGNLNRDMGGMGESNSIHPNIKWIGDTQTKAVEQLIQIKNKLQLQVTEKDKTIQDLLSRRGGPPGENGVKVLLVKGNGNNTYNSQGSGSFQTNRLSTDAALSKCLSNIRIQKPTQGISPRYQLKFTPKISPVPGRGKEEANYPHNEEIKKCNTNTHSRNKGELTGTLSMPTSITPNEGGRRYSRGIPNSTHGGKNPKYMQKLFHEGVISINSPENAGYPSFNTTQVVQLRRSPELNIIEEITSNTKYKGKPSKVSGNNKTVEENCNSDRLCGDEGERIKVNINNIENIKIDHRMSSPCKLRSTSAGINNRSSKSSWGRANSTQKLALLLEKIDTHTPKICISTTKGEGCNQEGNNYRKGANMSNWGVVSSTSKGSSSREESVGRSAMPVREVRVQPKHSNISLFRGEGGAHTHDAHNIHNTHNIQNIQNAEITQNKILGFTKMPKNSFLGRTANMSRTTRGGGYQCKALTNTPFIDNTQNTHSTPSEMNSSKVPFNIRNQPQNKGDSNIMGRKCSMERENLSNSNNNSNCKSNSNNNSNSMNSTNKFSLTLPGGSIIGLHSFSGGSMPSPSFSFKGDETTTITKHSGYGGVISAMVEHGFPSALIPKK